MNDGIVIQARTGSTRMPAKILLPFDGEQTILDILLEKIKRDNPGVPVVVATTEKPADDTIETIARNSGNDNGVLRKPETFLDGCPFVC